MLLFSTIHVVLIQRATQLHRDDQIVTGTLDSPQLNSTVFLHAINLTCNGCSVLGGDPRFGVLPHPRVDNPGFSTTTDVSSSTNVGGQHVTATRSTTSPTSKSLITQTTPNDFVLKVLCILTNFCLTRRSKLNSTSKREFWEGCCK